jgi:DNA repair protein RadC
MSMNDNHELGGAPPEQNTFPDALAEPDAELLRAVFPGALFVSRLARAPGGWRTLSKHELDALELSLDEQEAVLALQILTQLS